jgi:hypothetical protein
MQECVQNKFVVIWKVGQYWSDDFIVIMNCFSTAAIIKLMNEI